MSDKYDQRASDWRFTSVAEFESQLDPKFHSYGIRLFLFQSQSVSVAAYVLFNGLGVGGGLKFNLNNETIKFGLHSLESLAKPSIGSEVKISLPRGNVPHSTLEKLTISRAFSLSELNACSGTLASVGVGLGAGVGAFSASAVRNGETLFNCSRLGLEFGHLGASATNLRGNWHVVHAWHL